LVRSRTKSAGGTSSTFRVIWPDILSNSFVGHYDSLVSQSHAQRFDMLPPEEVFDGAA